MVSAGCLDDFMDILLFRGVGVIAYMLVSGGVSPFWGGNRYRTMAKVE